MDKIIAILMSVYDQTERAAKRNAAKLSKHEDIKKEFEKRIETGEYPEDGLIIEGYSAKQISEIAPFMNAVGVYNFLVTLRDNPVVGLQAIKDGFPRRIIT